MYGLPIQACDCTLDVSDNGRPWGLAAAPLGLKSTSASRWRIAGFAIACAQTAKSFNSVLDQLPNVGLNVRHAIKSRQQGISFEAGPGLW